MKPDETPLVGIEIQSNHASRAALTSGRSLSQAWVVFDRDHPYLDEAPERADAGWDTGLLSFRIHKSG